MRVSCCTIYASRYDFTVYLYPLCQCSWMGPIIWTWLTKPYLFEHMSCCIYLFWSRMPQGCEYLLILGGFINPVNEWVSGLWSLVVSCDAMWTGCTIHTIFTSNRAKNIIEIGRECWLLKLMFLVFVKWLLAIKRIRLCRSWKFQKYG